MDASRFDRLTASPAAYRAELNIETDAGSQRLVGVLDPWQAADFSLLDNGWAGMVHRNPLLDGAIHRAYLERPRGHSKTTDLAVMTSWALFAARRQISGIAVAADKEQAALLRDAIERLVFLNPWLAEFLDVQRLLVRNRITHSELSILSSDAAGGYGQTPDFVIADELTHWKSIEQWVTHFSSAAKRARCVMVVISNAGLGQGVSWQWRVREACRTSADWYFSRIDGPQASWLGEKVLAEQRLMLPPSAYRRLWLNQWTQSAGDALEATDVAAALTLPGPTPYAEPGYVYASGLDLGVKHDHSAHVVLATKFGSNRVKLVHCRSWAPGPEGQVDLTAVEEDVLACHQRYDLVMCGFDPNQALLMAQRLVKRGVPMVECSFAAGKMLDRMARDLLSAFRSRMIELYDDPALVNDLHRLTIVERKYGFKLEAVSDEHGHADRAIALAIVLPPMLEAAAADPPPEESMVPEVIRT